MFEFMYDLQRDYKFNKEGYPVDRRSESRRCYTSKRDTLVNACIDFFVKKDKGTLYDVDYEVKDCTTGLMHELLFEHADNGTWSVIIDNVKITKYTPQIKGV